ncbi:homocysteine S-methyltransferase family protein [Sinorhizobium numidicum]|uniref:Homocysteine S-methyltransferase family protein n=1 Tax=Sinorhizobium numidicum TaxID=680248 RepID=A0ABY8CS39_9HYPH|nr:homocysteine S-methyltransferase family protein [Sinorhizobium numidicum]WEX74736.1 homocysteine S-methyltransferase family protein [Sinorhizobium numidicum]WEX80727.1 homocysteine S-methyltransferase family protein [Sinorhizobium numidicum]
MSDFRHRLPQLGGDIFLTDAGIETRSIFQDGLELPHFAAFHLLRDEKGAQALRDCYRRHAEIARKNGTGFILESATWRASRDWGDKLGYSAQTLDEANRKAIALLRELKAEFETERSPMIISGCIGPRRDGYDPGKVMSPEEAQAYHARQVGVFAESGVDLVTAITMTNTNEAIGVTRAAQAFGLPAVISFTVETDGRLPTGERLQDAIEAVDRAIGNGPEYFMINCAHPTQFKNVLDGGAWVERLCGIRANASKCSHAELDAATVLDDGNPIELGLQYRDLRRCFGHIEVLGGCCGTDHRHTEQIRMSCMEAA